MLNQDFYGQMRENPPTKRGGPVLVPCSKCKNEFTLEKEHKEVFVVSTYFARMKDGTLTPSVPKTEGYHRLCPSCIIKFKAWLDKNE